MRLSHHTWQSGVRVLKHLFIVTDYGKCKAHVFVLGKLFQYNIRAPTVHFIPTVLHWAKLRLLWRLAWYGQTPSFSSSLTVARKKVVWHWYQDFPQTFFVAVGYYVPCILIIISYTVIWLAKSLRHLFIKKMSGSKVWLYQREQEVEGSWPHT